MKKIILLISIASCCFQFVHAQPGQLDSLFGSNGIVKTDIGAGYSYELVGKQVLLQQDGGIYAILESGGQTFIGKKHIDGSIDSSYGQNGFSTSVALVPVTAAFQSNGKIVVAGSNFNGTTDEYMIIRFNDNGSPDRTFGVNGTQSVDFQVSSITTQTDGKILVAGSANNSGNSYFALSRYNIDGNLDSSFANNGNQITNFGFSRPPDKGGEYPESDFGYAVAIQNDGKIVMSGSALNYSGNSREFAIARYKVNGSLDSSFNSNGMQTTNFGATENYAYSIAFQNDGKIVVAGYANMNVDNYDVAIARYNTNGSIDNTFNGDGKQTTSFGSIDHYPNSLVIQSDGKIVVEGDSWDGSNYDFSISRYNKDGSLDNTFNGNGKEITDLGSTSDYANAVAIQNDGKIIEIGYTFNGNNFQLALVRYNTDGTLDNTFDKDGKLLEGLNQGYTIYTSSVAQRDGKIIAAGYTWNGSNYDFVLARYNTDGSLDSSFSEDGTQSTDFSSGNDFANSVSIQADGKIVIAGYTDVGNRTSYFALARYNTDGSLDKTFSDDGKQTTDFGFFAEIGNSTAIQKDGKIVMGGSVFTGRNYDSVDFAIARYNTDGTLDKTFSEDGKQITDLNSSDDFCSSVVIQNDGKIVATGRTWDGTKNDFALARYNTNGSLDNSFSEDGKQISEFGTADYFGQSAVMQSDGKIVMAGYSQVENVGSSFAVARYNTDGKLDTSFNGTGLKTRDFGSGFEVATSVAMQSNGKIVLAGGTNGNFTLARYNSNGGLDTSFSGDGVHITKASGGDDRIQGITIVNDQLYVVGYGSYPATLGVIAKYFLNENTIAPTVSITNPLNNAVFTAPATIRVSATAADADGTISKVEFYNGTTLLHTETVAPYAFTWKNVSIGNYTLTAKATDNNGLVTTSAEVKISVVENKAPTISITSPANNQTIAGPTTMHLRASAKDTDGTISKVEFYNGTTLLHTETIAPYTYTWTDAPVGTYTLTAIATDNSGLATTSEAVNISVVPNHAPTVSITSPASNESFNAPATISLAAAATDNDGAISKVEFYNGTTLIGIQYFSPYISSWKNIPAGTYTITAKAIDNLGLSTTSIPVTITVTSSEAPFVSSRKVAETGVNSSLNLKLFPNPANNIVTVYVKGLQQNKQPSLSIVSASGIVVKTVQISNATTQTIQLNVSSLQPAVYSIKVISGSQVMYKQFVKL